MILQEVLKGLKTISVSGDIGADISCVCSDSRKVVKGALFVAIKGERSDGHDFIPDAVKKGASAVIYNNPDLTAAGEGAVFVRVHDSRTALAEAANNFNGRPSHSMHVTGVTGTNGKTTTTYIIKSIFEAWGKKTGLIGTIQYMIGDRVYQSSHTTPMADEFQGLLRGMLDEGCTHVITEVSSHALSQRRVDATLFKTVIFTNLTRDHLDFHETMEDYYLAKERLFLELSCTSGCAVINIDDEYGRRLAAGCGTVYTYGLGPEAGIMASEIENTPDGLKFNVLVGGVKHPVVSSLIGLQNVYNILAAVGAGLSGGAPMDVILKGIRDAEAIRGRFERVDAGQPFLAVVDYAHTEDAIERLIYTARGLSSGRIITVFGCGGDRDRGKRPRMGAIATRLSDFVVITSDNPRSERPEDIISEIEAGAVRKNYLIEPDRKEAIKRASLMAGHGDVLLVAGKGHEEYQEIGGARYKFSDKEELLDTIRRFIVKT